MSDQRRRSLERAALSTGSPDDEARVLLERLRAEPPCKECGGRGRTYVEDRDAARDALTRPTTDDGMRPTVDAINAVLFVTPKPCSRCAGTGSLLRARVECAAFAGHEAARLALACDHSGAPWGPGGCGCYEAGSPRLEQWLSGISRWGVEAQVAAALGAARGCYPHVATSGRFYPAWHSLEAASAWLACPCEEHKAALSGNATVLRSNMVPTEDAWWAAASGGVWRLAHGVPAYGGMGAEQQAALAVTESARLAGEPAVREAAAAAVRRWALGGEA